MPVYMVSYDIPEDSPSYAEVVEHLEKALGAKRVLESQWLIVHEGNSEAILRGFRSKIREGDRLIVQKVVGRDFAWKNPIFPEDELVILLACDGDD
jgi:hypothetical protein